MFLEACLVSLPPSTCPLFLADGGNIALVQDISISFFASFLKNYLF